MKKVLKDPSGKGKDKVFMSCNFCGVNTGINDRTFFQTPLNTEAFKNVDGDALICSKCVDLFYAASASLEESRKKELAGRIVKLETNYIGQ